MSIKKLLLIAAFIIIFIFSGCKTTTEDVYTANQNGSSVVVQNESTEESTAQTSLPTPITPSETYYDKNGVWYEIFVRSFADGNGDGIGDFVGLTQKLDYLNDGNASTSTDLGVTGIWLMPINSSGSYHGYDVTDYYNVNSQYGTMEEFETFIEEAHKRGIEVIMDLVVNHTSSDHPWFQDAMSEVNSSYRDYYTWITDTSEGYNLQQMVWGHKVWNQVDAAYYYALFWDQMPDLNFENEKVREEIKKVGQFWLEKGVDGFRMDAAMHIYGIGETAKGIIQNDKNLEWWAEFDVACRAVNPDYYLVGEVWDDISRRIKYAPIFDSLFNFDVAEDHILTMVQTEQDLNLKNNGLVNMLDEPYVKYDNVDATFIDAPFLTNHDQARAMEHFAQGDLKSMKLATNILMTLPGNPFIYYGEELGMLGDKPDERIREPFLWGESDAAQTSWESIVENTDTLSVDEQQKVPTSLLNYYKLIIGLRQNNEALLTGEFKGIETTSKNIVAYKRFTTDQTLFVIHNLKKEAVSFDLSELGEEVSTLIYSSDTFEFSGEECMKIPAQTTLIFQK